VRTNEVIDIDLVTRQPPQIPNQLELGSSLIAFDEFTLQTAKTGTGGQRLDLPHHSLGRHSFWLPCFLLFVLAELPCRTGINHFQRRSVCHAHTVQMTPSREGDSVEKFRIALSPKVFDAEHYEQSDVFSWIMPMKSGP
jgi:hypothetical protein